MFSYALLRFPMDVAIMVASATDFAHHLRQCQPMPLRAACRPTELSLIALNSNFNQAEKQGLLEKDKIAKAAFVW